MSLVHDKEENPLSSLSSLSALSSIHLSSSLEGLLDMGGPEITQLSHLRHSETIDDIGGSETSSFESLKSLSTLMRFSRRHPSLEVHLWLHRGRSIGRSVGRGSTMREPITQGIIVVGHATRRWRWRKGDLLLRDFDRVRLMLESSREDVNDFDRSGRREWLIIEDVIIVAPAVHLAVEGNR